MVAVDSAVDSGFVACNALEFEVVGEVAAGVVMEPLLQTDDMTLSSTVLIKL